MMFVRLTSFLLVVALGYSEDISIRRTCAADGTCTCEDRHENCQFWADNDECTSNSGYMFSECPKACNLCGKGAPALGLLDVEPADDEFGVAQKFDQERIREIETAVIDMKTYFRNMREDPATTPKMHDILDNCKNKHESCAFWKVIGECEQVSYAHLKMYIK